MMFYHMPHSVKTTVAHKYKHAYKFKYTHIKPNTRIQNQIHTYKTQYTHTKLNTRIQNSIDAYKTQYTHTNSIHTYKTQYTHTKLNTRIQNSNVRTFIITLVLHDVSHGNEQNKCGRSVLSEIFPFRPLSYNILPRGNKQTNMFCSHCGQENDKNANFCKSCGASVSENKSSPSSSTGQQPLRFKEYLEKKSEAGGSSYNADMSAFKNERLSQIKKDKKDEIVKVHIFTNILKYTKVQGLQVTATYHIQYTEIEACIRK